MSQWECLKYKNGYYLLPCCQGHSSHSTKTANIPELDSSTTVNYQYEVTKASYTDKSGDVKISKASSLK